VLVHGGLYWEGYGAVVLWFAAPNIVAALCLVAAGFLHGRPAAWALWAVPLVNQFVTPWMTARAATGLRVHAGHFVERHGLLLLVALGESVVAVGIGLGSVRLDLGLVAAAVLGLALAGGVAIYLAGDVAFRRTLEIRPVGWRAAAALLALGTALLGVWVAAGVQLVALVAVLVATMAAEARWRRRRTGVASPPTATGPAPP
jgi:low temperature requirement protein LtrA